MFPSYKNQSVDLPANQLTGFYVMGALVVKRLTCFSHCWLDLLISSVIRQKGEPQNGCYKKTKHAKFSEKLRFLTPYAYQGVKNFRFSENLACLFPCNTRFEIFPFILLPTIYISSRNTSVPNSKFNKQQLLIFAR